MDRECNKCVYHTSGSCSAWECTGTKTVEDVRADAIDEVICILKHRNTTILENGYEYHGYDDEELEEIAEQLKEQKNESNNSIY